MYLCREKDSNLVLQQTQYEDLTIRWWSLAAENHYAIDLQLYIHVDSDFTTLEQRTREQISPPNKH